MAGRRYTGMTPSGRPGRNPMREAVERYKDAAEAQRARKTLGSMRDILGRAGASQRMEAEEARRMGVGNKKGGKIMKTKKYAAGGLAGGHKSADGIAKKGKTRGMEVRMAKGGKAKGGMTKGCK